MIFDLSKYEVDVLLDRREYLMEQIKEIDEELRKRGA